MKTIGIIEVGSNGLRYEVCKCLPDGHCDTLYKQSTRSSLISYVDGSAGRISPKFRQLTLEQIKIWQADARGRGVDRLIVLTTEVGRQIAGIDAGFWEKENLVVNVLSPVEEALLSWRAGKRPRSTGAHGAELVVDVGNGSMSLTIGDTSHTPMIYPASVGGSKIAQLFWEKKGSNSALEDLIRSSFDSVKTVDIPGEVTLMGGFATKAAWQVYRPNMKALYRSEALEGQFITRTNLRESQKEIYGIISTHGAKAAQAFVDYKEPGGWKLMHVIAGLSFFDVLGSFLGVEEFRISTRSVRHGALSVECEQGNAHDIPLSAAW